jgi:hypothetical protein
MSGAGARILDAALTTLTGERWERVRSTQRPFFIISELKAVSITVVLQATKKEMRLRMQWFLSGLSRMWTLSCSKHLE